MPKNNLVSVVIPVYNSEKFLDDCIESVLNQTYKDIEIICIDDGSTDSSLEILKNYGDKISFISQENQGLASALNRGIQKIQGEWFKWFSPDDIMKPDAIETLVKYATTIEKNTILYSNWEIIDEEGKLLRKFDESNYNHLTRFDFNVRLLDGQLINVNTCLIPSSLFSRKLKMNTKIDMVFVDYDLFLHAGLINNIKFYLIEDYLIKYRIHPKQSSHEKIKQSLDKIDSVKQEVLSKLNSDTRNRYLQELKDYQKDKPLSRKFMETGLKLISNYLPESATDKLLVFYLNKIRRSR